jgi:hypothetical protein
MEKQLGLEGFELPKGEIIKIKKSKADKKVLTKEQKAFNRNTKRIENLTKKIEETRLYLDKALLLYTDELFPLQRKQAEAFLQLSFLLDQMHGKYKFTKTQSSQISAMVVMFLHNAFEHLDADEKSKALYDKHSPEETYEEVAAEQVDEQLRHLVDMLELQFGVKVDKSEFPDLASATEEDVAAFMYSLMERLSREQQDQREQKPISPKRKKTAKQIEKEKREEAAEEMQKKSMRSIYLSLAKVLHPDMTIDNAEGKKNEELMKQVTQAYEKKDLAALLRLEMEWIHEEEGHLENLADEQLVVYNKALKEQVKELENEFDLLMTHPRYDYIRDFIYLGGNKITGAIIEEKEMLNQRVVACEEDLGKIRNKKTTLEFVDVVMTAQQMVNSLMMDKDDFFSMLLDDDEDYFI